MRVTALIVVVLLCGCTLHLPETVKSAVSGKGAHATRAIQTPIGIYFTSVSFVPGGSARDAAPPRNNVACTSNTATARVFYTDATTWRTAQLACRTILEAITYISRFGRIPQRVEYQAVLIPEGEEREARKSDFYPYARIRPRFLVFDTPRMTHGITGVFAHEYVHMFLELTQKHHEVTVREEAIAYTAELCAQLNILGSISQEDLPGGPIAIEGSDAVERSSDQGYAVRRRVYPHLSDGALDAKSAAGERFLKECGDQLQEFFGGYQQNVE